MTTNSVCSMIISLITTQQCITQLLWTSKKRESQKRKSGQNILEMKVRLSFSRTSSLTN